MAKSRLLTGPTGTCNIFTIGVPGTGGDDLGGGFEGGRNDGLVLALLLPTSPRLLVGQVLVCPLPSHVNIRTYPP